MAKPGERPLQGPAPLQHGKAFLVWLLLDDAVVHAVDVAPSPAALGRAGATGEGQTQAGPLRLTVVRRRQQVAILYVGSHDRRCEPVPLATDKRDVFEPDPLLGTIVATRLAHPDAFSAWRLKERQP